MLGILFGFFSLWGWNGVWFVALQDLTPVCPNVWCPLFLSSCSVVSSAPFSLFLSFSGAGETQTPFRGFGIPLVSLLRGRALRLRPVRLARLLPLGQAPAPVFFFFLRRRRSLFWWWLVSVCLVSLCLGVCVSGFCFSLRCW